MHARDPEARREARARARAEGMPRTDDETLGEKRAPQRAWEVTEGSTVCRSCCGRGQQPLNLPGWDWCGNSLFSMPGQGGATAQPSPLASYPSLLHSVLGDRSGGPLLPPTQLVPPV